MRRLDRYIFREILSPTLIALVALTFIVLSQRGGLLLDIIFRQSPTPAEIWSVTVALLPLVLPVTLPMAVLMGILTGFSRLSSDSEAIAMRAAGISMRRILRPVLVFATIAWIVTLTLTFWITPRTTATLRTTLADLVRRIPSIELRSKVFREVPKSPLVIWMNESQSGSGIQGRGIILVDRNKPDEPEFTFAESGTIALTNLNKSVQFALVNSSRHVIDGDQYQVSQLASNILSKDLPEPDAPPEASIAEAETGELWNHLRAGTATSEEIVEFHHRLALPFACFAFALIGFPLGVSTSRGGRSTGIVLSLILMFAYYLALFGGTRAGLSPLLAAWLPNIVFSMLGIYLLIRSDRQHENRVITALAGATQGMKSRLAATRPRTISLGRWAYTLTYRLRLFRLLDAYVLRGFCFFFAIVLGVFASLFIIVTLFELLPDIIRHEIAASTVIVYFIYYLPQIFYWVVPLAVLLAILINLGTLTKTNEILAVKAGAISLYRMSLPVILMAGVLSGIVYLMQDYVLPSTNRRQDEYHDIIKGHAPQTYRDPSHRKLMMGSGNRLYYYTLFDPNLSTFANLHVLKLDPKTFQPQERFFAKRARWDGSNWTLEEGWHRTFTGNKDLFEPFDQRSLPEIDPPAYFKREVREADQMNYAELQVYVDGLRNSGVEVGSLTVDLYRKLSFPMVTFIMALIGVPFSFKTGRKGAFYGIGFCLAVGIIYWATFELFRKLGGINQLSPFVAAWFPNIIFGTGGFWMMLRMKT